MERLVFLTCNYYFIPEKSLSLTLTTPHKVSQVEIRDEGKDKFV